MNIGGGPEPRPISAGEPSSLQPRTILTPDSLGKSTIGTASPAGNLGTDCNPLHPECGKVMTISAIIHTGCHVLT